MDLFLLAYFKNRQARATRVGVCTHTNIHTLSLSLSLSLSHTHTHTHTHALKHLYGQLLVDGGHSDIIIALQSATFMRMTLTFIRMYRACCMVGTATF